MTFLLYNTLTRATEAITPLEGKCIKFYACGPTVYSTAHLGNFRTYLAQDILRRALMAYGYEVTHVMNITDVGHLQSDADDGEDKLQLAARRADTHPLALAQHYEAIFFKHAQQLNLLMPTQVCRATEHIQHMIDHIQVLVEKNYTYQVDGNVYFDVSRFPHYAAFGHVTTSSAARVEHDHRKRHPNDFVLWFSQSKYPNHLLKWSSPWGDGFPGWHIECSAMAMHYLGQRIDIHAGGVDHIPIHHTNEMAQSEAYLGHTWVSHWMHTAFLTTADDQKMSKSNHTGCATLDDLTAHGIHPMAYRWFCLNAHYRHTLQLTWHGLQAAQTEWLALCQMFQNAPAVSVNTGSSSYDADMQHHVYNDLNTHGALLLLRRALKDPHLSYDERWSLVYKWDAILGTAILAPSASLNTEQQQWHQARITARAQKNWALADTYKQKLHQDGWRVHDHSDGTTTLTYVKR
jgi:cysteinyl-tRNA synthetase